MLETLLNLASAFSLVVGAAFFVYVIMLGVVFRRQKPDEAAEGSVFEWHFLVPCRDEEAVIGATLERLRSSFPASHVWVIDDASTDSTAAIVGAVRDDDDHVHLVSRIAPNARCGKGAALNQAYDELCAWLPNDRDRASVIVAVVDADGELDANALNVVSGPRMFGNERVGAVQVEVRIRERHVRHLRPAAGFLSNLLAHALVRVQDIEFRVTIAAMQHVRERCGTVALGGNGQFTRLLALDELAVAFGEPWHGALLEDYELGLHLSFAGWGNEFTRSTWVEQEGLWSLRRFVTQRTRWSQGMIQCSRYFRRVWEMPRFSTKAVVETGYTMMQPWTYVVGTFCYPLPLVMFVLNVLHHPGGPWRFITEGGWGLLLYMAAASIGPFFLWPILYRRYQEPSIGRLETVLWGFAFTAYALCMYVITWRAFIKLLQGDTGWAKTKRNSELAEVPAAAGANAVAR
jgi:1,2-diacylglycerol 3-beta-glucosyltransferase